MVGMLIDMRHCASTLVLAGLLFMSLEASAATRQEIDSPTLSKIQQSNVVAIGYREGSPPFSYLDDRQRPIGYSIDICMHVVDAIKTRLQLNRIDVRMVPATPASRIALVRNGTIDLECGVSTNTAERQKQVSFTVTTFVTSGKLLWKKSSGFSTAMDLRGRTVVSTVGTTNIQQLASFNARNGLDIRILAASDDSRAFRLVQSSRAAAYAMDEVLLRSTVADAPDGNDYVISEDTLSIEPYAVMLRKDDPGFKQLADDAIKTLYRSGEIHKIYRRWFESPIPPRGVILNMPMSTQLERAIRAPIDSGEPADYLTSTPPKAEGPQGSMR